MKFFLLAAAFVAITTSSSFPRVAAVAQNANGMALQLQQQPVSAQDDEALTPVRISVQCVGVDFSKFSLSSGAFVGNLLQASYNKVVDNDEADDSALSNVAFTGGSRLGVKAKSGEWKGSWDCDKCAKDTSGENKQWVRAFVAALKASNDKELRLVKSCTIDMGLGLPSKEENALRNVEIEVDCKNVDMKSLSVTQGTVLARAIQRTYNAVHRKNPSDDSSLEYVVRTAVVKTQYENDIQSASGLTRRRYPGNLGLMHICRLCPRDDDLTYGVQPSGTNLKAWQAELADSLRQSNAPSFRKVKKCTINVVPFQAVEYEQDDIEEPYSSVRGGCAIQ